MRFLLELFFVVVVALVIGGWLSWYSIQNRHGFGALNIDRWTAWPQAGSRNADPYTKAKVAADGEVPLDAAEGIAFIAKLDSSGTPLQLDCSYRLEGTTPVARLWTIAAHNENGDALFGANGKASVVVSRSITRSDTGAFSLNVSPQLAAGNWLPISGAGTFNLIFRLYDSQIINTRGLVSPQMPGITRGECAS